MSRSAPMSPAPFRLARSRLAPSCLARSRLALRVTAAGRVGAAVVLLAGVLTAAPAAAQLGGIFGEPPPRPPGAVPRGQPLPPPGSLQPLPPLPDDDPLPPEPGAVSPPPRGRPGAGLGGFESRPLAPPGSPAGPLPPPPGTAAVPPPGTPPGRPPAGTPAPSGPAPSLPEEVVTEVPTQKVPNPTAVFSGLDKITGRITKFEVAINETVQYGALQVRPRACYTRPPTEAPNTTGFVEVDEVTLQGEMKKLFRGWMFAASPGLHGVEHSIYDVWLSDCKGAATVAEVPPPAAAAQQPAAAPPQRQRQPSQQQRQPRPPPAQAVPALPRPQ